MTLSKPRQEKHAIMHTDVAMDKGYLGKCYALQTVVKRFVMPSGRQSIGAETVTTLLIRFAHL